MGWHDNRLETHFLEAHERLLNFRLQLKVSHSIRGRLRVFIPILTSREELTACGSHHVSNWQGVVHVASNYHCGSITIHYDADIVLEKTLIERLADTTIKQLLELREHVRATLLESRQGALSNLKKATVGIGLSLIGTAISGLAVALVDIYLFFITLPVYKRAFQNLINERRLTFDLLYCVPLTIGLLAGEILITSLAIWFTYFGDYMTELTAPGSNSALYRLAHDQNEDGSQGENRRSLRVLTGMSTLVFGIIMVPLPGPGVVITSVGLGMLAPEFPWAKKLHDKLKSPPKELPMA